MKLKIKTLHFPLMMEVKSDAETNTQVVYCMKNGVWKKGVRTVICGYEGLVGLRKNQT
jgi:hypothetical protein